VGSERPYPATPDTATRIAAPVTKHYYANGQRVATRMDSTLYYVHGDLPSASLRAGLGRFIQPDTLVPDPLNPQAWNRFLYVYNNPINYVDPSGHAIWVPLLFIGFGALAGGGLYAFHLHYTGEQYNTADLLT